MNRLLVVVGCTLVLVALAVISKGMAERRTVEPIAGDREYDAGLVRFAGAETVIEHTFRLTNQSGRAIHPVKLGMSCGCLDGQFDCTEWKDGEERTILVRMNLRDFGRRSAVATIICEDAPPIDVVMTAVACPDNQLTVADGAMQLNQDGEGSFTVRLLTFDDATLPPTPTITANRQAQLAFGGWTRELAASVQDGIPARFVGAITVRVDESCSQVRVRVEHGACAVERLFFR